jgi:hypothetical protein
MMQMIRALSTMLFLARQAELAAPTDSTGEAHADQTTDFDVVGAAGPDGDDAPDTFVAADVMGVPSLFIAVPALVSRSVEDWFSFRLQNGYVAGCE